MTAAQQIAFDTIDFETYYDKEYSLSRLTTEEYIRDPRFEIILCNVRDVHGEAHTIDGALGTQGIHDALMDLNIGRAPLLAHFQHFDGAILAWRLGIVPKLYLDSMAMATAVVRPHTGSASLAKCALHFDLPAKGTAVKHMLGVHRADMDQAAFDYYADYCGHDTFLAESIFLKMYPEFPRRQLLVIDRVIRMFTQPRLELDVKRCKAAVKKESRALSEALTAAGITEDEAMSNQQFAEIVGQYTTMPTKVSPRTGKRTLATAKKDTDFIKLTKHPNLKVQLLMQARLLAKSTIERTRMASLLLVANRNFNRLPMPFKYYGAHTGRLSGFDDLNPQNYKKKGEMKKILCAPKGHAVIKADQGQIEARLNACWSKEKKLVEAFRLGRDIYSEFASMVYRRLVTRAQEDDRFVGKTCILGLGYGMGAQRLKDTLEMAGVFVTLEFCQECVDIYRTTYDKIKKNWAQGQHAIQHMATGTFMGWGPTMAAENKLCLPNGMALHYPELQEGGDREWRYRERIRSAGVGSSGGWTKLYGAKLVENAVQAMTGDIIMEQMVRICLESIEAVMQVHDELVFVVPANDTEKACRTIHRVMTTPPEWMIDIPLKVEIKVGDNYGECEEWQQAA